MTAIFPSISHSGLEYTAAYTCWVFDTVQAPIRATFNGTHCAAREYPPILTFESTMIGHKHGWVLQLLIFARGTKQYEL